MLTEMGWEEECAAPPEWDGPWCYRDAAPALRERGFSKLSVEKNGTALSLQFSQWAQPFQKPALSWALSLKHLQE